MHMLCMEEMFCVVLQPQNITENAYTLVFVFHCHGYKHKHTDFFHLYKIDENYKFLQV